MLRCASWEAVSSKQQAKADKVSLERQRETNLQAIHSIGGKHIASLIVPGQSRSIVLFEDACRKIDAYRQLKELIDTRAIDLLVCYTHSRLGREISLCESVIAYCLANGVAIYDCCAPPRSINPDEQRRDVGARLMSVIRSWESQAEVERLKTNSADGVDKSVLSGNFAPGPKPKFWRVEYTREGGKIYKINEGEAAIARRVVALYLTGLGTAKVGQMTGLTRKGALYILDQARRLAGNVTIKRDEQTIVAKGKQPAIIDEATMQRVVDARARRKKDKGANATYIYSRLVTCEPCGKTMHAKNMHHKSKRDGSKQVVPALNCPGCGRWLSFKNLDREFQRWLDSAPDVVAELQQDQPQEVDRGAGLQDELTRVSREKGKLIDLYTSDLIELPEYKKRLTQYQQREQAINSQLQQLSTEVATAQQHDQLLVQLVDILRNEIATMSTAEVNTVYRECLRVVYTVNREVNITIA